jgi:hypothetical protein
MNHAARRPSDSPRTFSLAELDGLPQPVARYFRFALTPGQEVPRRAEFEQRGEFALRPGRWRPMRAMHEMAFAPPGFVWRARISMMPLVHVRVMDEYFRGEASMRGVIAGIVPVVSRKNSPGLAESSLHRWLAEAPLLPCALLPGAGVSWEAIDDATARATVTDAGLTVSMDAHFAGNGALARISAMRKRDVDGVGVPTEFTGTWDAYQRVGAMMVPTAGEASWILPEGTHSFWRATVTCRAMGGVPVVRASAAARS